MSFKPDVLMKAFREDEGYQELLNILRNDKTLDLEVSNNHAVIYYRGCGIMQFFLKKGNLTISIDKEYKKDGDLYSDIHWWVSNIPNLKQRIDMHHAKRERPEEEYKQILVRENNSSCICHNKQQCVANGTDYYIADIEYPLGKKRADCIAVYCASDGQARKKMICKLALIEMKFGTGAAGNGKKGKAATISQHIQDLNDYLLIPNSKIPDKITNMQNNAQKSLERKFELSLLCINKSFSSASFSDKKINYILVLANYKPIEKDKLKSELITAVNLPCYKELKDHCNFYISKASFVGYGLYHNEMITFEEAIESIP